VGDEQLYRLNAKLRRRGQAALESNRIEFSSEDYDDDEQFCQAIASELLELIKADREYLNDQEGESDE
jgi:hypothetical protein